MVNGYITNRDLKWGSTQELLKRILLELLSRVKMYLAKRNTAMNIEAFVNLLVQSIELS